MKNILIILSALISVTAGLYLHGFKLNTSHSYPYGIYKVNEVKAYGKNDLVMFCPPSNHAMKMALERGYIKKGYCSSGTLPMVKRIIAITGDHVSFNPTIRVNNIIYSNAPQLPYDSTGQPLPIIKDLIVGKDKFIAFSEYAPHNSFDSRYFGEADTLSIAGRVTPVLLF